MINIMIIDDEKVRLENLREWSCRAFGRATNVSYRMSVPDSFEGYDVLMLDHDLGAEGDVYDALRNQNLDYFTGHVIVHSMNPVGAQNIARMFRNARVTIRPYSAIVDEVSE